MFLKKLFCVLVLGILSHSVYCQDDQRPGCLDSLKIPNAWTPNGDGNADYWAINFPCAPQKFSISVYNRWGEVLFISNNPNFQWTGVDEKGNKLEIGVYSFTLDFTYLNEETTMTGNVVLMR